MLRDPKDVAKDWEAHDFDGDRAWRKTMADLIRARDREVIAEAKRVVHGVHSFGDIPEDCECTYCDALDAILEDRD